MMTASMPSPIGHTLAGLTVGWLAEGAPSGQPGRLREALTPFVLWCALLAVLPDADLLIPHFHRTATHSVTATALVLIIAAGVTGKVTVHPAWRFIVALAAAHASHLLLDWLGFDRNPPPGIQLLWPFSDRFYISGWELFPPTARGEFTARMIAINVRAVFWETILLGPLAAAAWTLRQLRRRQAYT